MIDVSGGGRSHATNLECGWGMTGILASGLLIYPKIGLAPSMSSPQVSSTLPVRRIGEQSLRGTPYGGNAPRSREFSISHIVLDGVLIIQDVIHPYGREVEVFWVTLATGEEGELHAACPYVHI